MPVPPASTAQHPESPAATLLALFQAAFAAQLPSLDPLAPSTRAILEQYAFVQQAALSERVSNLLTAEGPDSPLAMKLMRLLLSCLTNQERTSSRRSRERAARQREARQKAKDAKSALVRQKRDAQQRHLEAHVQRELNLLRAGLDVDPTETESKDAKSATDSGISSLPQPLDSSAPEPLLPQDATPPSNSRDFAPAPSATPDSERHRAIVNGEIPASFA